MSNRIVKGAAGLAALVVIGVGAALIGGASSGDASGTRNASDRFGFGPPGGAPGRGALATGSDAAKAKAAALKKYPGTVEAVIKTPDGSYVVHVLRVRGEVHVLVGRDFTVKGVDQGRMGPPPGADGHGGPPPGAKGHFGPPPGANGQGGPPPGAPQSPQQPGSGKTS
jgi:hypothetical protein